MAKSTSYKLPKLFNTLLNAKDWNIKQFAEMSGASEHVLYKNLQGKTTMSLSTALQIVNTFKLKDSESVALLKELNAKGIDNNNTQG